MNCHFYYFKYFKTKSRMCLNKTFPIQNYTISDGKTRLCGMCYDIRADMPTPPGDQDEFEVEQEMGPAATPDDDMEEEEIKSESAETEADYGEAFTCELCQEAQDGDEFPQNG